MKSLSLYYKEENKRIAADMVVLFLEQKDMILEMKNPENQKWEYFPILSILKLKSLLNRLYHFAIFHR
mgnify:CR=1 FL=1